MAPRDRQVVTPLLFGILNVKFIPLRHQTLANGSVQMGRDFRTKVALRYKPDMVFYHWDIQHWEV